MQFVAKLSSVVQMLTLCFMHRLKVKLLNLADLVVSLVAFTYRLP